MSNPTDETVAISKAVYARLLKRDAWLSCLEGAGVDNWDGYDYAQELAGEQDYDDLSLPLDKTSDVWKYN